MKKRKKVIVGISGGVDSSVAALLLKNEGYEVSGLFMKNWHDTVGLKSAECPYESDMLFAKMICKQLQIPFHSVDLSKQYRQKVVNYMFSEYQKGNTPNPDVLCNREIKFEDFLKEALKHKVDYVATGHYCRIEHTQEDEIRLLAGKDSNKDQSYFLCQLSQQQLKHILFPLGDFTKDEVREIALEKGLSTAKRKDSQGICFIGKVDLPTFLKQRLAPQKGSIIEIDKNIKPVPLREDNFSYVFHPDLGTKIGTHEGAHFYTIGQRKGIKIGGKKHPLYVLHTDVKNNLLYVGQGHDHPLLFRNRLRVKNKDIHWLRESCKAAVGEKRTYRVRIRHRQELQKATLHFTEKGLDIHFENSQRAITSGQFAAWYEGDELIGSGVIA